MTGGDWKGQEEGGSEGDKVGRGERERGMSLLHRARPLTGPCREVSPLLLPSICPWRVFFLSFVFLPFLSSQFLCSTPEMDGDFIYKNLKELFNNLETFNILVMFRRVTLSHLPLEFGNKVKKKKSLCNRIHGNLQRTDAYCYSPSK